MDAPTSGFRGMLNAKKAANYIGIGYQTFLRLLKNKNEKIPYYSLRSLYFFKPEDLDEWIERHRK